MELKQFLNGIDYKKGSDSKIDFYEITIFESLPSLIYIFSPTFNILEFFACPTSCVLATAKEDAIYSWTSSNSSSTEISFPIFVKIPINNPEILSKTPFCFKCARYVTNPLPLNIFNKTNKILCKLKKIKLHQNLESYKINF